MCVSILKGMLLKISERLISVRAVRCQKGRAYRKGCCSEGKFVWTYPPLFSWLLFFFFSPFVPFVLSFSLLPPFLLLSVCEMATATLTTVNDSVKAKSQPVATQQPSSLQLISQPQPPLLHDNPTRHNHHRLRRSPQPDPSNPVINALCYITLHVIQLLYLLAIALKTARTALVRRWTASAPLAGKQLRERIAHDRSCLSKVPAHLALLISSDMTDTDRSWNQIASEICEASCWAWEMGVERLSVYDCTGELQAKANEIVKRQSACLHRWMHTSQPGSTKLGPGTNIHTHTYIHTFIHTFIRTYSHTHISHFISYIRTDLFFFFFLMHSIQPSNSLSSPPKTVAISSLVSPSRS